MPLRALRAEATEPGSLELEVFPGASGAGEKPAPRVFMKCGVRSLLRKGSHSHHSRLKEIPAQQSIGFPHPYPQGPFRITPGVLPRFQDSSVKQAAGKGLPLPIMTPSEQPCQAIPGLGGFLGCPALTLSAPLGLWLQAERRE